MLKNVSPTYQTRRHGRNDSYPFESIAIAGADYPQSPDKNLKKKNILKQSRLKDYEYTKWQDKK